MSLLTGTSFEMAESVVRAFLTSLMCVDTNAHVTVTVCRGWSGVAMALGKLPVPGQGPVGAGGRGGLFGHFTLIYRFSTLSPSLWERRPDID